MTTTVISMPAVRSRRRHHPTPDTLPWIATSHRIRVFGFRVIERVVVVASVVVFVVAVGFNRLLEAVSEIGRGK